jgi:25S rRNA (adenine2142-N1)-methyltransferase
MAVKKRQKALSHGRPPTVNNQERMSSQQSRTIIRSHHRLQKERAAAIKKGDRELAENIAKAIEKNGGLKLYQAASKQGQSKERGGDSSKVLVEWLQEAQVIRPRRMVEDGIDAELNMPIRCLEIGALSTKNEISKLPRQIEMTRIDLNSQESGIEKQDFMARSMPKSPDESFDVISLSLVLNYVPDPAQRGEMLKRVPQFLRSLGTKRHAADKMLPALFLVLPLPCIDNSRYLNEQHLLRILKSLGFSMRNKKKTSKLCYYLFTLSDTSSTFKTGKKKLRDGPGMNNFCIVVD